MATPNEDISIRQALVDGVHIEGNKKTSDKFVKTFFGDLTRFHCVADILRHAGRVRSNLLQTGCFNDVAVVIDRGDLKEENGKPIEKGKPVILSYKVYVEEKSRVIGKTHVSFDRESPDVTISLGFPNTFGCGECFDISYGRGFHDFSDILFSYRFFPYWKISNQLLMLFHKTARSLIRTSGLSHHSQSSTIDYIINNPFRRVIDNLKLTIEAATSNVYAPTSKNISIEQRLECDQFNHLDLATQLITKQFQPIKNLYCSVIGNVGFRHYTKGMQSIRGSLQLQSRLFPTTDTELRVNAVLKKHFVLGSSSAGGRLPIFDRLFLGGFKDVRGFEQHGINLHDSGNAYGAKGLSALAIHLYRPLPYSHGVLRQHLRMHGFFCCGTLWDTYGPALQTYHNDEPIILTTGKIRTSCGFGLYLNVAPSVDVEFNYVIPLSYNERLDKCSSGFQFGAGVNLL